jgi:hypothetical protein
MISADLFHRVMNRLQLILGFIELGEQEPDLAKRKQMFDRAREETDSLKNLLKANRREEPARRKKKK